MIAKLRGRVADKEAGKVTVDVGGVGYEVAIPIETYSRIGGTGDEVSLHIYTHVRENALALFGFDSQRDKNLFEKCLNVSGVGPRLALALLSGLSTPDLLGAIRTGDTKRLVRVPGVGKKTAERIVLELRDKVSEFDTPEDTAGTSASVVEDDVISVLVNLGCSPEAAARAVASARRKGASGEFESLFREAMEAIKR